MEEFYDISLNTRYEYYTSYDIYHHYQYNTYVLIYFVIGIGLPLTLLSFCGIFFQVRNNEAAPIYIINLLVSNIIQFCCMIVEVATKPEDQMNRMILVHGFAVFTSLAFRVCVSMERYLIITWPLWYHFRRTTNVSAVICVMVWTFSLTFILQLIFWIDPISNLIIFHVLSILPLPLFIFFLVGTCKALSTSSVPSDEKRRIVAVLVLVLLNYMLLSLPAAICFLLEELGYFDIFTTPVLLFIFLSPLADLFLYIFSRKGAVDKLLSSLCCCIVDSNNINTSTG